MHSHGASVTRSITAAPVSVGRGWRGSVGLRVVTWLRARLWQAAGLDVRYAGPIREYLRRAIEDRLAHPIALGSAAVEASPGVWRYRRALQVLSPTDRELVVARVELGYSYEQLAVALNLLSAKAARSAARTALVRLAAEMARG